MKAIPNYTREQFLDTGEPYAWLLDHNQDAFEFEQLKTKMREMARMVGCTNFLSLFKQYQKMVVPEMTQNVRYLEVSGMEKIRYETGLYTCDDDGVRYTNAFGGVINVCPHPIFPVMRMSNIDTAEEKMKIVYKHGQYWRIKDFPKEVLSSASKIVSLSSFGVAVNSESAKELVKYLTDIESINYEMIPTQNCVGRLGWIDGYGFAPYVEDLVFDGEANYKSNFDAIKQVGEFDEWVELVKDYRQKKNIPARIMLASSFASVLVSKCNLLPFIVHLHGGTGNGKTVALMLCASVWGNPEMGKYIHSFNSTSVAQELNAAFYNSLPLIFDEFQIVKDKKSFDTTIYQLCEGVGRARGSKGGGLQTQTTWSNCILTSGEFPISSANFGGGAINRIIEIDCSDEKLFDNGAEFVKKLRLKYGWAGRKFVEWLQEEDNMQDAIDMQTELYEQIVKGDSTEKQSASASLILTADRLIERLFFHDGITLSIDDISKYLSTKSQVDQNARALEYLYDYVSVNNNKFGASEFNTETWGKISGGYIYIIKSQFDKIMYDEGFNPHTFLTWAKQKDLIKTSGGKNTTSCRFGGSVARCVVIKEMAEVDDDSGSDDDDLPDF